MGESVEPTVSLSPAVTLDSLGVIRVLEELSGVRDTAAKILAARIHKTWRFRGSGNTYITLRLTANELELVRQTGCTTEPHLVKYQYLAVYRHPETRTEVTLRSTDRPPRKRSFRLPAKGRKKFRRIKLYRINSTQPKESQLAKAKTKKKNQKATEDEDELESLEELEELEEEEPDDDEEEDDEEEDETPPKRRKRKSTKKSSSKKKSTKKSKKSDEDEDEEDDEEDEDDEEEPPKKKKGKKDKKGSKSSKKGKKKGKGKSGDGPGRSTAELTGGVGSQELAEAASEIAEVEITGRDVRVYLRKNEIEKDEEHGRYVWPSVKNKTFVKLAKQIAAEYEED